MTNQSHACMYTCMATKTISLDLESYERLRAARVDERESFSRVIKRAIWPPREGTAAALLAWRREAGDLVSEEILDALDATQKTDEPAEDKWKR